jgi:hypothetical protein
MRAFLAACAAVIVLAAGGVLALGAMQRPLGIAFSTDGARINPAWSWRQVFRHTRKPPPGAEAMSEEEMMSARHALGPEECDEPSAYLSVDFGATIEDDPCAASQ